MGSDARYGCSPDLRRLPVCGAGPVAGTGAVSPRQGGRRGKSRNMGWMCPGSGRRRRLPLGGDTSPPAARAAGGAGNGARSLLGRVQQRSPSGGRAPGDCRDTAGSDVWAFRRPAPRLSREISIPVSGLVRPGLTAQGQWRGPGWSRLQPPSHSGGGGGGRGEGAKGRLSRWAARDECETRREGLW